MASTIVTDSQQDKTGSVYSERGEVTSGPDVEELQTSGDEDTDDSDDNSDGDDIFENDTDEDAGVAEEPITPTDPAEVPLMIQALEVGDTGAKNDVLNKLSAILLTDTCFVAEHLVPRISDFLRILASASKPPLSEEEDAMRTSLLSCICEFFFATDTARGVMAVHLDSVIVYLRSTDVVDRQNILGVCERMAEEDPSTHDAIEASIKIHLYDPSSHSPELVRCAMETFENVILYGRENCIKFFLHAGALASTLHGMASPNVETRLASQSCLGQIYGIADTVDSERVDLPDTIITPARLEITRAFVHSLNDEDRKVVAGASDFLHGTGGDEVNDLFMNNPKALMSLVVSLATKESKSVGFGAEWLLIKLGEGNECAVVREAFKNVWEDEDIPVETKLKIIDRGVTHSFLDLRTSALDAGLCGFILRVLKNNDDQRALTLVILGQLMEQEQTCGFYLLKESCIGGLLDILEGPVAEERHLAASILARLLDCYSTGDDRVAQRDVVGKMLTEPDIYPRILASLHSADAMTAGATATILAEALLEEDGDESWSYEAKSGKPPPPTPLKDVIVTPEIIAYVIGLIKIPEAVKGALYLLCQFCWGYPRGFDMVRIGFETVVPDADVFFFASLHGEYEYRHAGRQQSRVAEAAILVGALPRTIELLELEALSNVTRRQAAVESLRVILCAESADMNIARKNATLPRVLESLVADETKTALSHVVWMLRVLENEEDQSWIVEWKNFGNSGMIEHLVKLFNSIPYSLDPEGTNGPDCDTMEENMYEKAQEEYSDKLRKSQEACEELTGLVVEFIRLLMPVIGPHGSAIIGPLLIRSYEMSQNRRILETLNKLLAVNQKGTEALVGAIKHLLSLPSPPSINQFDEWIQSSPTLASASREAGLADWLLATVTSDAEDDCYMYRREALVTFGTLIKHTADPLLALDLKKAFFANEKALGVAIELISVEDDNYSAAEVAGALATISKDFPEGLAILDKADLYSTLLKLLDDPELSSKSVAPLMGQVHHSDDNRLTQLLRSYISALTTPPPNAQCGDNDKKKKKKKKKAYMPRMSESDVWDRFTHLCRSSPATRMAVIDAGAITAGKAPLESNDTERLIPALDGLRTLLETGDGCAESVSQHLPRVAELLLTEDPPYTPLLYLARAFLPNNVPFLVSSGVHCSLVRALGEFPSSFNDMSELIDAVHAIAQSPIGQPALTSELRRLLALENVEEYELTWGYVHALRRLLDAGDAGPSVIASAGGVEFAVRMLKSETISVVVQASNLCAYLALSETLDALPLLVELGAVNLIESARKKALDLAAQPFPEPATGEEVDYDGLVTHKYEIEQHAVYAEKMLEVVKVLQGEVKSFSANYY